MIVTLHYVSQSASDSNLGTRAPSYKRGPERTILFRRLIMMVLPFMLLVLSFFMMIPITAVWAATYYVDATSGKDTNDGLSQPVPWKTIAKVNRSYFQPGDQILFKRGEVWMEKLTVPSSGSADNPITSGAYGSGAKPVISGGIDLSGGNRSYITIRDLEIRNARYYGIFLENGASYITVDGVYSHHNGISGLQVYDANHSGTVTDLTVKNSEFAYNASHGISILDDANTVTITGNRLYHNSTNGGVVGAGLYVKSENSARIPHVTVTGNEAYSNGAAGYGTGIYLDTVDGATAIVRYNYCHENVGNGIVVEYQSNTNVTNNLLVNNGSNGLSLWRQVSNNLVYNNTLSGNATGISLNAAGQGNTSGNQIKNNISSGNRTYEYYQSGATNTTISTNAFGLQAAAFVYYEGSAYSTYAAWETAYGGTTKSIQTDPLFTNVAGNDFTLTSSSPDVDAGVNLGDTYKNALLPSSSWPLSVTTADQNLHGSGWELGAYVYKVLQAPTKLRFSVP